MKVKVAASGATLLMMVEHLHIMLLAPLARFV